MVHPLGYEAVRSSASPGQSEAACEMVLGRERQASDLGVQCFE